MTLSVNDKRLNSLKNKPGEYFVLKYKDIDLKKYHPWMVLFIKDHLPLIVKINSLCVLQEGKIGYLLTIKEDFTNLIWENLIWELDQQVLNEDFSQINDPKDLRFLDNDILQ